MKFPGGVFKKNSCEISIWAFLAINLEISKRGAGALCMSNNFAENLEVKACFLQEFLRMVKVTENIKILGFSFFFFRKVYPQPV